MGVPVNQAPPELRTQIRERLQFTLRQLNLPHDGTNPELRQRLRDYELGETGTRFRQCSVCIVCCVLMCSVLYRTSLLTIPARELREKGALEFDGTETWMDLRQKVLGYYETELAQRGISAKGSLKERKERLRFCLEGALPVETKAEQKKKKLTKKK